MKMTKQEAKSLIDVLIEAPDIIKLAKQMVEFLPKGKSRDALIKDMTKVKKALIALDVRCQDIEWSIAHYQISKAMKEEEDKLKEMDNNRSHDGAGMD